MRNWLLLTSIFMPLLNAEEASLLAADENVLNGELLFAEEFEFYAALSSPVGERLRPSTPVGATDPYPINVSNNGPIGLAVEPYSGSPVVNGTEDGNFLRLYDYHTGNGISWEKNFVDSEADSNSTLRISFQFASSSPILDGSSQLRFSVGRYAETASSTLGASSGRPFLLSLKNNGQLTLDMEDRSLDTTVNFDVMGLNEVVIFINDAQEVSHTVTGPDGEEHTLYVNSVTVFLNDTLVQVAELDPTLNYLLTERNLGRFGFFTLSGEGGADFVVDSVRISAVENPDTVTVPWPDKDDPDGNGEPPLETAPDYNIVFIDDEFNYTNGELGAISFYDKASGGPLLYVADGRVVYDYGLAEAGSVSGHYRNLFYGGQIVATDTRAENAFGPAVYVRFNLNVSQTSLTTDPVAFMGLNNPDLVDFVNARVWIRRGSEADTYQLGVSPGPSASNVAWAETLLSVEEEILVVIRYNNETNDSRLWLNPESTSTEPDAIGYVNGDLGYYAVNAVSLLIDNTINHGTFTLDNLRVCGSEELALDFTPVVRPDVLLSGSSGNYNAESSDYRVTLSGNMLMDTFSVGGERFLVSAEWDAVQSGTVASDRRFGSAYVAMQTMWQLSSAAFSKEAVVLNLQNNDQENEAVYRFVFDKDVVVSHTEVDDVVVVKSVYNSLTLKGIDLVALDDSERLVVEAHLEPRETRTLKLICGLYSVESPMEWQVFQRETRDSGWVNFSGRSLGDADKVRIHLNLENVLNYPLTNETFEVPVSATDGGFEVKRKVASGGWHSAEIEFIYDGEVVHRRLIRRFGVGEVFVGAGQSNSTNSGTEPIEPENSLVASFSGGHWQAGVDPQPGNHDFSSKGSYYPALGDRLAEHFDVPIAFASTGMGASAIRFWQPDYSYDYQEYTNYARHNGLYNWTLNRIRQLGKNGFRAVLWHQGESDSSHSPEITRTPEEVYYNGLKHLILSMREEAEWDIPWYVARASVWPLPESNPQGDPNIHRAQMRLWADGIAHEGANSDSLNDLSLHQPDGSRVHFNKEGLYAHGELWAERIIEDIEALFENEDNTRAMLSEFGEASIPMGGGYFHVHGLGVVNGLAFPWIWSDTFGWFYTGYEGSSGSILWLRFPGKPGMNNWVWTWKYLLPWAYSTSDADWLYFLPDLLVSDSTVSWVYRYSDKNWHSL